MILRNNTKPNTICRPVRSAVVLLVLGLAPVALAQSADPGNRPQHAGPPQEVVDRLVDRGFRQVQPSIFERELESGSLGYETVVYGVDGHIWLLGQQEAFLETLQARYDAYPAVELLDAIAAQEERIAGTRTRIEEMMETEPDNATGASVSDGLSSVRLGADEVISVAGADTCTTTITRSAAAGPDATGAYASALAGFKDDCGEIGTVSATAIAQGRDSVGILATFTDDCGPQTGSDVTCSAYAHVDGVSECFTSAQANVTFGFLTYSMTATNVVCPSPQLDLFGTTSLFVPWGSSRSGSWSASMFGGTPPYHFQWFFNNAPVGTNSTSYGRSFPHVGYATVLYYTVKVTATDSSNPSLTATRTLSVRVEYGSSGGGCLVSPDGDAAAITVPCEIEE